MLYETFAAVAAKYPDSTALLDGHHQYTYAQAIARIEELCGALEPGAGRALAILGEKDCDTVLWQLACSRIGTVFLPLDVATPDARLELLLGQTQPRWVACELSRNLECLGYLKIGVMGSRAIWETELFRVYQNTVSHIFFSSGSTGAPKTILLPDAPVPEVVLAQSAAIGLGPGMRFAWLLSPSFDASLSDVYATLLSGAALHVVPFAMSRVKRLQAYLREHQITHTDLAPSVLPLLNPLLLPDLRAVVFGGELASEAVIQGWVAAGKRMFNAYGPTETTICSSLRPVDANWTATNIGKPLPGVHYWFLQDALVFEPQPRRVHELYIGGTHLAVGYENSDLSNVRFRLIDGHRYYKTGDLVELDDSGDFHFKGRVDRQLKHHGVLICPEEVERAALRAGCREALLAVEDERLVLSFAGELSVAELQSYLEKHLLPFSVPRKLIQVNSLAKSLSGKVQL